MWKVVFGVWDYIKNSGKFPDSANLTLEWVGHIPGKRESRRFIGDYMIHQKDIIEQRHHDDAVSFGGWAVDLHPADGVYSDKSPCNQFHSKGVYQIPYCCLYSKDVPNLFLGGRLISATHIAFGSTRVMMTGAHGGQVVGTAAALCLEKNIEPRELLKNIEALQACLLRQGQFIPHHTPMDKEDLANSATIEASSTLFLESLTDNSETQSLDSPRAMMLPARKGRFPVVTFIATATKDTEIEFQLRVSERVGNYTPDTTIAIKTISIAKGGPQAVTVDFEAELAENQYAFVCLMTNEAVCVALSDQRLSGVLSLSKGMNKAVAKGTSQIAEPGSGIDSFEFWLPGRRPGGKNLAIKISPPLEAYSAAFLKNGYERPFIRSNAWVAAANDLRPTVTLSWSQTQRIRRIVIAFDGDHDHPMESAQLGHPENIVPFTISHYRILDECGNVVFEDQHHRMPRADILLNSPLETKKLSVEILETRGTPAAIFNIRCYA